MTDDTKGLNVVVLKNIEGQFSLWPTWKSVPGGWAQVFGPQTKELCLEYVEREWTDLRPVSLRQSM